MRKRRFQMQDLKIENVIELMNVYLSEWEHRDEMLWAQVFKHFYATLIVMFLPNIASFLNVDLPRFPISYIPYCCAWSFHFFYMFLWDILRDWRLVVSHISV